MSSTWSDGVTPNVTRTYDAAGRLLSLANGVSTSTYAYDNANRLLSETQAIAGLGSALPVSYSYDADGNRTGLTYPSGTAVTYGYTGRNKISSVTVSGTSLATYAYDGNNNIVSKTLADGTLASYTYDAANRLTTLNHTLSGTSFARFDYGYDVDNRRMFEQRDNAAGDTFSYDAIDQVTAVHYDATNPTSGTAGADRTVGYTYDATGNRTQVNDSVNGNASYTANSDNEYTNVGGASYGSDANGNLITGNGLYFYDAQNRLNYAQVGSNIDQLSYDSKNRVVKRTVNGTATYFIYDGWDLIEERDGSGTVLATYVHGVRQDEMLTRTASGTTVYYHHNALGSVTNLTNASGTVVEKYKYDAFGKPAITDGSGNPLTATAYGNRFMFTGREYLAEVNLYDYRNRVYSSDLGRFLQTDPIRFEANDVNIYRYCANNPINENDPSGMVTWSLGVSGNAQIFGIVNVNGSVGITGDWSGNIGGYGTLGGGFGVGAGGTVGGTGGISSGTTINDLSGLFAQGGGSAGAGLSGTLEGFGGVGTQGQPVVGGNVTVGGGGGASVWGGGTYTWIWPWIGPAANPNMPVPPPAPPAPPPPTPPQQPMPLAGSGACPGDWAGGDSFGGGYS